MNETNPVGNTNETPSSPVAQTQNLWDKLPDEIGLMILNELDYEDLSRASLVSRSFDALAADPQLWHEGGMQIGIPESKLNNNAHITVKQVLNKINRQASAAGIQNHSLNTPGAINQVKLQIHESLQKDYESLQKDYESLQNSLSPTTRRQNPFKNFS